MQILWPTKYTTIGYTTIGYKLLISFSGVSFQWFVLGSWRYKFYLEMSSKRSVINVIWRTLQYYPIASSKITNAPTGSLFDQY